MAGYVFKITLENAYPPVWRRVLVLEKITFYDLHSVIQTVFGWDDMHLHSFSLPSQHVEIGPNDDGWSEYDETETLLEQFIFEQKNLRYTFFLSVKKFSIIRAFEIREFRRICAS